MEQSDHTDGKGRVVRRRAWWQWVLGLGLLAAAAVYTVFAYFPQVIPGYHAPTAVKVKPREVRISPDLRPVEAVPASPGDLAGSNLLIVTFDTTRADHIGVYGNDRVETPAVDRLAREGVLFSRTIAPAPTTLPSHSSIMTGLFPYRHGARANNTFRLGEENTTLAEVLAAEGYATGAMVSAFVLDSQFGIGQGFQDFDDDVGDEKAEENPLEIAQRTADATYERAVAWLREHAGEKFFLWVHFYDPHFPYEAPSPFSERYDLPYDAEIAFTDVHLAKLMAALDELRLTDDTLVVMAGDHGEGLGQHQELFHACLIYDSVMRVPMVMRCGRRLGGGVRVDRAVSLVDVAPTVLSLLGIDGPGDVDGVDLTQPQEGTRPIFVETLQGLSDYGWAALLGVHEGTTKYIYGPDVELYDLQRDPFEQENLSEKRPEVAATMLAHLEAFFGTDLMEAASATSTHQISPEDLARLQSLGYMGGGGDLTAAAGRPHPRDMMPLLARVDRALIMERKQGLDAAIAMLERFVEEHPDFEAGRRFLGDFYVKRGDLDLAEQEYAVCLELRPADAQPLMALAGVKVGQRDIEAALELYRQVLTRDPDHFGAQMELGRLLIGQGEYLEAVDVLTAALETAPRNESIPDMLADTMASMGRAQDAMSIFRRHLETEPDLPMVRNALARLLAGTGEFGEAVTLLREGIEIAPEQLELVNNLSFILVSCPDAEVRNPMQAVVLMERVCEKTGYEDPRYMHTLSMVYAAMLRMDEAITVAERARKVASSSDRPDFMQLAPAIGRSLQQYRAMKEQGVKPADVMSPPDPDDAPAGDDTAAAGGTN